MSSFLIADDSEGKVHMLKEMLKRAGWTGDVLVATTTEEAMRLVDEQPAIAAAFIDYYIPSANGPAVIRCVKAKNPQAHIALVSSSDNQQRAAEARSAGAEACVCTTYRSDEVEKTLVGLLEDWKSQA